MMKWITTACVLGLATSSWAQFLGGNAQRQPPPGTISSPGSPTPSTNYTYSANPAAGAGTVLTNRTGGVFTVEQLGAQLQALRSVVDQTLPMLSSFNQRYVAAQPGATLGKAIQNIFSGNKSAGSGQEITNVLSALGALVSTNRTGTATAAVNPNTLRELVTLQNDLQPVSQVLQSLSLTAGTNRPGAPVGGVPSPAGR